MHRALLASLPMFMCLGQKEGKWPSVHIQPHSAHVFQHQMQLSSNLRMPRTISPSRFLLNIQPSLWLMFHNMWKPHRAAPNQHERNTHGSTTPATAEQPLSEATPRSQRAGQGKQLDHETRQLCVLDGPRAMAWLGGVSSPPPLQRAHSCSQYPNNTDS